MKKAVLSVLMAVVAVCVSAQEFNPVPRAWKWTSGQDVVFSYDGTFADSSAFAYNARTGKHTEGVKAPAKYSAFPVNPEGAVNLAYSPDSTKLAFTRDNDLYVVDIESGAETRLTFDGSDVILNGYASWVYFEEIFGRPSKYRAFWWSPDSKKIGFYRFDNSQVPMFPIYSAFTNPAAAASRSQSPRVTDLALGGSLSETRYPKAGQTNPQVRIGIVDLTSECISCPMRCEDAIVWADFDETADQYFGIPFWGPDSKEFFIARMPRLQNTIDLYAVNPADGSKRHVYNETYKTWLNWFEGVVFTDSGLYMAREFETGWQQIYFLSYDGTQFRRLTDGPNWNVAIVRVDEKKGDVYFTARRDAVAKQTEEFTLGHLPDSTWTFVSVDTRVKDSHAGNLAELSFYAPATEEYMDTLAIEGKVMVISVYDTDMKARKWNKTERFISMAEAAGFRTLLLCADMTGVPQELADKAYTSDYKTLISLNRSNAGVTYFYNGQLIRKWASSATPSAEELDRIAGSDATEIFIEHESKGSLVFQGFLLYFFAIMLLL